MPAPTTGAGIFDERQAPTVDTNEYRQMIEDYVARQQELVALKEQGEAPDALLRRFAELFPEYSVEGMHPMPFVLASIVKIGLHIQLGSDGDLAEARRLLPEAVSALMSAVQQVHVASAAIAPLMQFANDVGDDDTFCRLAALNDALAFGQTFGAEVIIGGGFPPMPAAEPEAAEPVGFTLTDGRWLEFGGQGDRYRKNMAALRLMRQLQAENRPATPDEQWLLAHYSAFGESALLNRAIDDDTEFQALTSQAERHAITEAALTAFYTPQEFLDILWDTLAPVLRAYSGTLHILEPAFGVGMFVATMPMDIRQRSNITAIELDQVSSDIAGYLHPDVNLLKATAFEDAVLEDGTYDLVVSNVPFSGTKVFYPPFAEPYLKRCLHDFFIARSIQLVRPGGLVCVLTSYGTMDKADERTREWIAERADLVAALRLPQGAFASNSGTMCGADLLIFCRK